MNITRNSFRETNSHYRALKRFIHNYLETVVFPYCLDGFYKPKKKTRDEKRIKQKKKRIQNAVRSDFKQKSINIVEATDRSGNAVEIKPKESTVVIRPNTDVFRKFSKKERELLQEVLVIFESAVKKATENNVSIKELKEYFYKKLKDREN